MTTIAVVMRERWLYLSVAYAGVLLLLYGVRFVDMASLAALFADPFALLPPEYQFLHGSPLGPLLGHLLGIREPYGIYAFFSVSVVGALAALVLLVRHTVKADRWVVGLLMLALSPLIHVLLSWLGKSDPLLIVGYVGFVLLPESWLLSVPVFIMMLAHREQASIILVLHGLLFTIAGEYRRFRYALPGVVLAFVWFAWYADQLGGFTSRATSFMDGVMHVATTDPIALLMSALLIFGWFWLVVAYWLYTHPERIRLAIAVAVVLVVALVAIDHTRVGALLSLPILLFVLRAVDTRGKVPLSLGAMGILAAASLCQVESAGTGYIFSHWLR